MPITDIIATWIYLDSKGKESFYLQVNVGASSSSKFQKIYWRCLVVFFATSLRFNSTKRHILFTNTNKIPIVDNFNIKEFLQKNNIEIIQVENEYQVPKGYFHSWNNQFYEFSILKHIRENFKTKYQLLLLDSDCIFNASVDSIFRELEKDSALAYTYTTGYPEHIYINGLNRIQMQQIFSELGVEKSSPPNYSGGEIILAKKSFIDALFKDFDNVWQDQLQRNRDGKIKFNEEAHLLSYFYYKYNANIGKLNNTIKQCWTNPFLFRNINPEDINLPILHFPNEKNNGLLKLYKLISKNQNTIQNMSFSEYKKLITYLLSLKRHYFDVSNIIYLIPKRIRPILKKLLRFYHLKVS